MISLLIPTVAQGLTVGGDGSWCICYIPSAGYS